MSLDTTNTTSLPTNKGKSDEHAKLYTSIIAEWGRCVNIIDKYYTYIISVLLSCIVLNLFLCILHNLYMANKTITDIAYWLYRTPHNKILLSKIKEIDIMKKYLNRFDMDNNTINYAIFEDIWKRTPTDPNNGVYIMLAYLLNKKEHEDLEITNAYKEYTLFCNNSLAKPINESIDFLNLDKKCLLLDKYDDLLAGSRNLPIALFTIMKICMNNFVRTIKYGNNIDYSLLSVLLRCYALKAWSLIPEYSKNTYKFYYFMFDINISLSEIKECLALFGMAFYTLALYLSKADASKMII